MRRWGALFFAVVLTVALLDTIAPVAPARATDHGERRVGPADTNRVSPSLAVDTADPSRVAMVTEDRDRQGFRVFVSRDGGRSFGEAAPPPRMGWASRYEPTLEFIRGRMYLAYSAYGGGEAAVALIRSDDFGLTWSRPRYGLRLVMETKDRCIYPSGPWLAVDPERPNVIHLAWESWEYTNGCAEEAARVWVARSEDGGTRFGPAVELPLPGRGKGDWMFSPRIVIRPGGGVAVAAEAQRPNVERNCPEAQSQDIVVGVSDVGGRTLTSKVVAGGCSPTGVFRFTPAGLVSITSTTGGTHDPGQSATLAVDPRSGAMTTAWMAADAAGTARLFAAHSADGGRNWRAGAVPSEPGAVQLHQPYLTAARDGRLLMTYMAQFPGGVIEPRVSTGAHDASTWSAPASLAARPSIAQNPPVGGTFLWLSTSIGRRATTAAFGRDGVAHTAWVDMRDRTSGPTYQVWSRRLGPAR